MAELCEIVIRIGPELLFRERALRINELEHSGCLVVHCICKAGVAVTNHADRLHPNTRLHLLLQCKVARLDIVNGLTGTGL